MWQWYKLPFPQNQLNQELMYLIIYNYTLMWYKTVCSIVHGILQNQGYYYLQTARHKEWVWSHEFCSVQFKIKLLLKVMPTRFTGDTEKTVQIVKKLSPLSSIYILSVWRWSLLCCMYMCEVVFSAKLVSSMHDSAREPYTFKQLSPATVQLVL